MVSLPRRAERARPSPSAAKLLPLRSVAQFATGRVFLSRRSAGSVRHASVLGDPVFGILVLADRKSELTEEVVR
jgi:hypothetical protein